MKKITSFFFNNNSQSQQRDRHGCGIIMRGKIRLSSVVG